MECGSVDSSNVVWTEIIRSKEGGTISKMLRHRPDKSNTETRIRNKLFLVAVTDALASLNLFLTKSVPNSLSV